MKPFLFPLHRRPSCAAYVLQVIMEDSSLQIESLTVQKDYKNLYGRSATLDCVVRDAAGRLYDVEIQQDNEDAQPARARYYSALLDMNTLDPGEQFDRLPETYVIFISQGDIPGDGLPIYHISRTIEETGKYFADRKGLQQIDPLQPLYIILRLRPASVPVKSQRFHARALKPENLTPVPYSSRSGSE